MLKMEELLLQMFFSFTEISFKLRCVILILLDFYLSYEGGVIKEYRSVGLTVFDESARPNFGIRLL